ncbi:MAG: hypothetical protein BJ554DRAFT_4964 [Olpidium bornovanus]|uniref:Uncharacterized protein n=1 Tax=Olpidium bornovanus TaxID=278681 RepID=A0A8H7ZM01_9FUNG|nr:MAG: hypothetical protein BJ554DRAFT_4964 [Olpidium bornovanus]
MAAAALSSAVASAIVAVREYWHVPEAWHNDNTRRGLRVKLEVRAEAGQIHGHRHTQPKAALPGYVWARVSDGWPPEQRSQTHSIIQGPPGILVNLLDKVTGALVCLNLPHQPELCARCLGKFMSSLPCEKVPATSECVSLSCLREIDPERKI